MQNEILLGIVKVLAEQHARQQETDAKVCETCGRTGAEGCDDEAHIAEAGRIAEEIIAGTAETVPFDVNSYLEELNQEITAEIEGLPLGELIGRVLTELGDGATLHRLGDDTLYCSACTGHLYATDEEAGKSLEHDAWCLVNMAVRAITMTVDVVETAVDADKQKG